MMRWQIIIIIDVLVNVKNGSGWWLGSTMMKALAEGGSEQSDRRQNFDSYVLLYCSYVRNLTSMPATR
jgi:hypothetical protein